MRPIVLLLAVLALFLAGCGGGDESGSGGSGSSSSAETSTPEASGGGQQIALSAPADGTLKFDKSALKAKAGKVTINFDNPATVPHAVEIEGGGVEEKTDVVSAGKASLTADLKPGKYEFYCPVGDHREDGMEGTLTVQ
jgi:plastocyanin